MSDLDDFLSLKQTAAGLGAEDVGLESALKPTTVGLNWIDAPSHLSNGICYRIHGCNLQRIRVSDEGDDDSTSSNAEITATCSLTSNAVHVKASPDGRMVAVACIDGSLQCFDSTQNEGLNLRWTIPNAHSHVSAELDTSLSKDRSKGACKSGPLLALDFSPNDYKLVVVDANQGVAIYDARCSAPTNLIKSQDLLQNVSCACWQTSATDSGNSNSNSSNMPLAIGTYNGSIAILEYTTDGELKEASDLGSPSDDEGFVCTHLNWNKDTLVAGLLLVTDDGEEPDEEDEDDLAEHEAAMYVTTLDSTYAKVTDWSEQGDVVPFFTVPKYGRHVFYTSVLSATKTTLIAVATNVGTDIGSLSPDEDNSFQPVEFQEGAAATTPTNEDDEFVFPLGICLVQLPSSKYRLLLVSTDGSLTTFEYQHTNDPEFFSAPLQGSTDNLPSDPVATIAVAAEKDNWVVVDDEATEAAKPETESKPPETAPATTTSSTPFSFGVTGSSTFGAAAKPAFGASSPSAFGSGSSKGLTFGSSSSGSSPFAAFGATSSLGGATAFGKTSTIGTPQTESKPATSAFGASTSPFGAKSSFGSTTFGSTTTSGGGFGALAASPTKTAGGFGSSSSTSTGFGSASKSTFAFGGSSPSPFKSFSSPTPASTIGGFPVKPLFGSAPKTETPKPTATEPAETKKESLTPKETTTTTTTTETPKDDKPLSDTEKAAAKAFDEFDTEKAGSLEVEKFEDLSEALGEGFHGDEYDAQVALVDPSGTGKITRDNFIQWYKALVEGGDSDDESLDTAELEEREEERQSAKEAFGSICKNENGKSFIESSKFGKVIEALGSVYCEEEHRKTIKKLKKDDKIYESDFLEWYIDWLFGDGDESEDEDDSDDESEKGDSGEKAGEGNTESLGSIFKVDESSWKCEVCSVRNKDSVNKCVACETPRPGFEAADAALGGAPAAPSNASIGAGGFSFGGAATSSSSIGAGGFSFGGATAAKSDSAAPSSSIGTGGFSFGGAATKPDAAKASTGFSFGAPTTKPDTDKTKSDTASSSIGAGGFSFGASTTNATPAATSSSIGSGGFSFGGKATEEKAVAPKTNEKELSDTEKAAAKAFDEFDTEKAGSLEVEKFEDLSEALGEGFHGDEYDAQVALVDPSSTGKITRENFIQWYKALVEGGDSDDESLDTAELEEREEERQSAKEAFGSICKTESGKSFIDSDKFGKVIEALGSVYCEEEHRKTIKKLKKDDKIYESDFLEWYIDWLFGDGDESEDEDDSDDEGDDEQRDSATGGKDEGNVESLGSIFKVDESTWKCEICSVRNKDSVNKCVACETPRPGFEDAALGGAPAKVPSNASIGAGGFSFGGAATSSSSIGAGGFSFGGAAAKPDAAPSSSSIGAKGFSFGASTAKPDAASSGGFSFAKPDAAPSSSSIGAGGFSFGGSSPKPDAAPSSSSIGAGGFSFGAKADDKKASDKSPTESTPKPDTTTSSSAAFPPMSKKAPTNPFGAKSTPKAPAFPPMSAKAPTNPFGAKPVAKAPASNAAFPPMSKVAPKNPFGAKPAAKAPASSAAFPPMSKTAPTNPFGAKPAAKAPASSAAFPPMSKVAPKNPFGAKPAAKAPTSSAAFPPMSKTAPTNPFGAKPAAAAPSSSSTNATFSSFGAKASSTSPFASFGAKTGDNAASKSPFSAFSGSNSPFGGIGNKPAENANSGTKSFSFSATASSNASPFGAKPTAKASGSAAFPPMSKTAPSNPFGAKPAAKAPTSSTNAAFPPMSSKAPSNPFGAKPAAKAPASSTNAAFPPMSSKAPSNPFGAKPATKAPAKGSANAAFPPMSSKAPSNPFGAKSSAKAPASSTNAAFPPMSSKAPSNPFGAKTAKAPASSSNAAFPPMSSKAPSNPFGAKPTAKSSVSMTKTMPSSASPGASRFGGSLSQKSSSQALVAKKSKTKLQLQLDSVISSFSSTISKVSQMRAEICTGDDEIRKDIEAFAIQTEQERSKLLNLDDSLGKNRAETAFLLSRKTDSSRQVDAAKKIVEEIKKSNTDGVESVAGSQALDQESERQRRKFAASSRRLVRRIALVSDRKDLLEGTVNDPADRHRFILSGVMNLYKRSKTFEEVPLRLGNKIDLASRTVPRHTRAKRSTGRSTYSLESSPFTSPKRHSKITPIRLGGGKQRQTQKSKTSVSHWKNIESSLQQMGNTNVKVDRFSTISIGGTNDQIARQRSEPGERRMVSHSLLMSPSARQTNNVGQERSLTVTTKINIFSPPSKTKARNGWDKPSTIDRSRMNQLALNAPQDLKQTTLSDASRKTLASFGTTPEKLKAAVDIKKNQIPVASSSVRSTQSKDVQAKRSTGASAAFPPMSTKAPSNPFSAGKKNDGLNPTSSNKKPAQKSTSSSAPLPPMPKQAPKNPFAKLSTEKPPSTQAQSTPAPAPAKASPFATSEKKSKETSGSSAFGNMGGLGNSLFSSGTSKTDTKQTPSFGAPKTTNSSETAMTKDYKAILTAFYQKHNPARLAEVEKALTKYKGREQEMFQKLATKYKVPNPLQESSNQSSATASSAGFSSSGFGKLASSQPTAPPSSGFGSTGASPFGSSSGSSTQQKPPVSSSPFGAPAPSPSPFGSSAAPAPSPFGSTASSGNNSNPFGSKGASSSASPFGSSTAPAPSPFGSTAPSTTNSSPFGSSGGLSSASPFGSTAAPTPFGAPSPSPMQPASARLFNGKPARDLLMQFYQEKNPSKLAEVDKLLAKYSGKEDQMFRNLAKKYQLDPSVFGVSAGAPSPGGFGAPPAAPAFGQASSMGAPSPFGSSGGFGQPSSFGGAPKPPASTFGSSSGFGSTGGFGSLAQSSPSPFGGASPGGFGTPAPAFGSPTPFGAPRR